MERILGRFAPQFYALMRIVVGLLFACHGAQKLLGVLGGQQVPLASQFGLAGVIELVGGVMIAVGFLAGFVALIASGEMAYAYFTVHAPRGPWPIQNGGELAAVYCFIFLYIASRGSGIWGMDKGGSKR
jgi:putative oxidoreductase